MSLVIDPPVARTGHFASGGEPRKLASVALLGGFEMRHQAELISLPMSAQRVVAFLALQDRPVVRVFVAGSLWPETTETRASANLRSALWRLSRPGLAVVDPSNGHLALSDEVDVDLRRSVALANRLLDRSAPPPNGEADPRWLAKDILPDWSEEWVVMEREHFRQLRLHALESLCAQLTNLGRFPEAIEAGIAAVAAEPLRESAHRALIRAHLAEGNFGEARNQYEAFRQILRDELDLEPSSAMEELVSGFASLA